MANLIEICLENIDPPDEDERYMRCVALPDAEPGLSLDAEGEVEWMPAEQQVTGLWTSDDERLILIRAEGTVPVWVERAGRSLEAPAGKPVMLLDQDLLRIGAKRLRLHVHGLTEQIFPPEPLPASLFKRMARNAAAAVALGAAALAAPAAAADKPGVHEGAPIEVRTRPPKVARPKQPVHCSIDTLKKSETGVRLQARCPAGTRIFKGMFGMLLDASDRVIPKGSVRITKVTKTKVWAEGKVKLGKTKAAAVRFMVYR